MGTENEIFRLTVFYTAPNASEANTVHTYQLQGGDYDDGDILTAMSNWVTLDWGAEWSTFAPDTAEITGIEVDCLNVDGTVKRNVGADNIGVTGDLTQTVLPAAVSALLSVPTATPGVRGRKYVPFIAETEIENGIWIGSALGNLAVMLADYFAPILLAGAVNLIAGVLSEKVNGFEEFLQTGNVRGLPRTQRRRYANVGS